MVSMNALVCSTLALLACAARGDETFVEHAIPREAITAFRFQAKSFERSFLKLTPFQVKEMLIFTHDADISIRKVGVGFQENNDNGNLYGAYLYDDDNNMHVVTDANTKNDHLGTEWYARASNARYGEMIVWSPPRVVEGRSIVTASTALYSNGTTTKMFGVAHMDVDVSGRILCPDKKVCDTDVCQKGFGTQTSQADSFSYCVECIEGTYAAPELEGTCESCPAGAFCGGGVDIRALPGNWITEKNEVLPCPSFVYAQCCVIPNLDDVAWPTIGGFDAYLGAANSSYGYDLACNATSENRCSPRREGPLCGKCKSSYRRFGIVCVECDADHAGFLRSGSFWLLVLSPIFVSTFFAAVYPSATVVEEHASPLPIAIDYSQLLFSAVQPLRAFALKKEASWFRGLGYFSGSRIDTWLLFMKCPFQLSETLQPEIQGIIFYMLYASYLNLAHNFIMCKLVRICGPERLYWRFRTSKWGVFSWTFPMFLWPFKVLTKCRVVDGIEYVQSITGAECSGNFYIVAFVLSSFAYFGAVVVIPFVLMYNLSWLNINYNICKKRSALNQKHPIKGGEIKTVKEELLRVRKSISKTLATILKKRTLNVGTHSKRVSDLSLRLSGKKLHAISQYGFLFLCVRPAYRIWFPPFTFLRRGVMLSAFYFFHNQDEDNSKGLLAVFWMSILNLALEVFFIPNCLVSHRLYSGLCAILLVLISGIQMATNGFENSRAQIAVVIDELESRNGAVYRNDLIPESFLDHYAENVGYHFIKTMALFTFYITTASISLHTLLIHHSNSYSRLIAAMYAWTQDVGATNFDVDKRGRNLVNFMRRMSNYAGTDFRRDESSAPNCGTYSTSAADSYVSALSLEQNEEHLGLDIFRHHSPREAKMSAIIPTSPQKAAISLSPKVVKKVGLTGAPSLEKDMIDAFDDGTGPAYLNHEAASAYGKKARREKVMDERVRQDLEELMVKQEKQDRIEARERKIKLKLDAAPWEDPEFLLRRRENVHLSLRESEEEAVVEESRVEFREMKLNMI